MSYNYRNHLDFNGHEFVEEKFEYYCKKCDYRRGINSNVFKDINILSCDEIQKIQQSHISGEVKNYGVLRFQCVVCDIWLKRSDLFSNKLYRPHWSELYSCNEYLMIKANE